MSGGDERSSDFEVVLDVTVRSSVEIFLKNHKKILWLPGVLRRLVGLGLSFVEDVVDDFGHSFDGDSLAFTDLSLFFSDKVTIPCQYIAGGSLMSYSANSHISSSRVFPPDFLVS